MQTIPLETAASILAYVDIKTLSRVNATSKHLEAVVDTSMSSQIFWKEKVELMINKIIPRRIVYDWKQVYEKAQFALGSILIKFLPYSEIVNLLLPVQNKEDQSSLYRRAIEISSSKGYLDTLKVLLPYMDSTSGNTSLILASENGHKDIVELLLKDSRVDPRTNDNKALKIAVRYDNASVVNLLLKDHRVNPITVNPIAIASANGSTNVIKILLADTRLDPSDDDNEAIELASQYGHTEVMELLLNDNRVDPSANHNFAIQIASRYGYVDIVKVLLNDMRVDPSDDDNKAFLNAHEIGHEDIMDLLAKDPRVNQTLDFEDIGYNP